MKAIGTRRILNLHNRGLIHFRIQTLDFGRGVNIGHDGTRYWRCMALVGPGGPAHRIISNEPIEVLL